MCYDKSQTRKRIEGRDGTFVWEGKEKDERRVQKNGVTCTKSRKELTCTLLEYDKGQMYEDYNRKGADRSKQQKYDI